MTDMRDPPRTVRQELDAALRRELARDERLEWHGMKLARIEPKGFAIWLFAIPWTGFALFWMAMASLMTSADTGAGILSWGFPAFGIPFVLIGIAMLALPFVPLFLRGKILFAVTDSRVLQLSLGRDLTVVSVPASRIGDIVRRESGDGTGSVELTLSSPVSNFVGRQTSKMSVGRVEDVRGAYEAILILSQRD